MGSKITVPPPPPVFTPGSSSNMQSANQPVVQGSGKGGITLPPPPTAFSIPGAPVQTSPPQASSIAGNAGQFGIGAAKGALNTLYGASAFNAGPVGAAMLANAPGLQPMVQDIQKSTQTNNGYQTAGNIAEQIGEGLVPVGDIKQTLRLANVASEAENLASEKSTIKTVESGIKAFGDNPTVQKDAAAIEPLVQKGLLRARYTAQQTAKNSFVLKNEIAGTAQGLVKDLSSMDITPTVDGSEIATLFQKAIKPLENNPLVDKAAARQSAMDVYNQFLTYLPKDTPQFTASDILTARKQLDDWVESIKGAGVFDPSRENGFTLGLRAFRQGANDLIASKAPDVAVKKALSYQTSLYNVLDNVAAKGAPAVKKAEDLANLPGLAGIAARHPVATGIAKTALTTGLSIAGLGAINDVGQGIKGLLSP